MSEALPPGPLILLVEDEPGIRESLELLLELEGFGVVSAANPVQALERLESIDCDLIITDQMMPRMDGLTFLRHVRAQPRLARTPAIMISAVPRPPDALAPLADAFIGKPFEAMRLVDTIRRLLAARARSDARGDA
ncbi:MAG TPA: response regulator [Lysobacter sp.]|nr:response regulator [Lysobacter sp.]